MWALKTVAIIGGAFAVLAESNNFVMTAKRVQGPDPRITKLIIQRLCIFEGFKIQKKLLSEMTQARNCERSLNG